MAKFTVRDMAIVAVLTTILFVQEELLSFLPNVQLTFFLIILFSKKLGIAKTSIMIFIHVILDNLVLASFNIFLVVAMMVAYMIIPITTNTIFKKVENNIYLALIGILYSFIYSWIMILPSIAIYDLTVEAYLLGDIWWEIVLALSTFVSVLWLYSPCSRLLDNLLENRTND